MKTGKKCWSQKESNRRKISDIMYYSEEKEKHIPLAMSLELKEFKVDERMAAKKLPFPVQATCSEKKIKQ